MSTFEVKITRLTIEDHPNADRIQIAHIDGQDYQVIVGKDEFQTGDLGIYIPEAAVVPDWILADMGLEGKLDGPQHNRVKAHKFRGVLSQGLVYRPPSTPLGTIGKSRAAFLTGDDYNDGRVRQYVRVISAKALAEGWIPPEEYPHYIGWRENEEVGDALGIIKYEPEVPTRMRGQWTPAPKHVARPGGSLFQSYTHLENIKRYPNVFQMGEPVVMREKLHGTCGLYYLHAPTDGYPEVFAVSSLGIAKRGYTLLPEEGNVYWDTANSEALPECMRLLQGYLEVDELMIFGEIIGVQDLKYGLRNGMTRLYLFDVLVGNQKNHHFINDSGDEGALAGCASILRLPLAPLVYTGPYSREKMLEMTTGNTLLPNVTQIREGVVIRPPVERENKYGRVIMKSINPDYLTRGGEPTEFN